MNNALYRQGMNRNMTNPIQMGGPNNTATKVDNSGLNNFMNNWRDTYLADPSETTKPKSDYNTYKAIRSKLVDKMSEKFSDLYKNKKDAEKAVDEYVGIRFDGDLRNRPQPGKFDGDLRNNNEAIDYGVNALDGDGRVRNNDEERISSLVTGIKNFLDNFKKKMNDSVLGKEVEVTIQPGQSFGQMLLDSGLATDHGLWGSDGDVAYYEKQLRDNGALDDSNSISAGQKFTLRKRK